MFKKLAHFYPVLPAFLANMFTRLMTVPGAAMVFLFKRINKKIPNTIPGFVIMILPDLAAD